MGQTQTEWEEEQAGKILTFIRHEIYLDLRYLKPALSALTYRRMEGLLTFASDGVFLYYAAEPLIRVFKTNSAFLDRAYLHTVLHCIFRHLWLCGKRDRRLWHIACDIVTEFTIDSMGKPCTKRILSLLRKDTYEALKKENCAVSAAAVYQWLKEKEEEKLSALAAEFYTDDHRFWPKEEEGRTPYYAQAKKNWDKTARQVTLEQNRRGHEAEEGEEMLSLQIQAAKNRQNYREFLQKFTVLREEPHLDPEEFDLGFYSYGLNLYGNLPLIEPLETREIKKIREFVIVIDTSYSTNGELVKGFLEETFSILSQKDNFFKTCRIRVLQCDDRIRKDSLIQSGTDFERFMKEIRIEGGGGTDFRPAFSYIEKLREKGAMKCPDGLLYFTDGKGVYPEKKPDYKTAFLFLEEPSAVCGGQTKASVPPWAMRVVLSAHEWARGPALCQKKGRWSDEY